MKEHIDAFLKNQPRKSAFASHLLESGHSEERVKVSLLHEEHRWRRKLALETIEIIKHSMDDDCTVINEYTPESGFIDKILYLYVQD